MKRKQSLVFVISLIAIISAHADDSQAVYFAKQAGAIAGASQACGESPATLTMRSGEVISALVIDDIDASYATAAYQRAMQDAYNNQIQSQKIACPNIISAYNNLPLLQPDYKQSVLANLGGNGRTPPKNASSSTSQQAPSATTGSQPTTPGVTPPSSGATPSAAQQVMQTPPAAQQYVSGSTNNQSPASDADRFRLAQQLTQMAQNVLAGSQNPNTSLTIPGQIPANTTNTPINNPQFNQQLQGFGANNPMFRDPGFQPYQQPVP